jgi:hypothetical protein
MPNFADPRIAVIFAPAASAGAGDAVLMEGEGAAPPGVPVARFGAARPGHLAGCACCAPRGAVATALHRLFVDQMRAGGAMFARVVVAAGPAGQAAVRRALEDDAFLAGRYWAAE